MTVLHYSVIVLLIRVGAHGLTHFFGPCRFNIVFLEAQQRRPLTQRGIMVKSTIKEKP